MDERYSHDSLDHLWSDAHRPELWAFIEGRCAQAMVEAKLIPQEAANAIVDAEPPRLSAMRERERVTRHDVAAFLDEFAKNIPDGHARWLHWGMTSSDLVDTANAQLAHETERILRREVDQLNVVLVALQASYPDTIRLGRTHGQPAEPVPLRRLFQRWSSQFLFGIGTLGQNPIPLKLSGAVGTYSILGQEPERTLAHQLDIPRSYNSTQIVPRHHYARWAWGLVELATACEAVGTEIRLSSQHGIGEAYEVAPEGAVGSTAMPHKDRNPVRAERLCGLARVARGLFLPLMETASGLWQERDISNSSVERTALKDLVVLTGWMVRETAGLLASGVVWDVERITENRVNALAMPTSSALQAALVATGSTRQEARRLAQHREQMSTETRRAVVGWLKQHGEGVHATLPEWYVRNV